MYACAQNGKMVVFLPYAGANCYDAGERALIESNGGLNNVITIPMWALFGQSAYSQGAYGFFSPCTVGMRACMYVCMCVCMHVCMYV